jgi:hypothetical protein
MTEIMPFNLSFFIITETNKEQKSSNLLCVSISEFLPNFIKTDLDIVQHCS